MSLLYTFRAAFVKVYMYAVFYSKHCHVESQGKRLRSGAGKYMYYSFLPKINLCAEYVKPTLGLLTNIKNVDLITLEEATLAAPATLDI